MSRGYVHIYTGNGKGKTTAALGLAMRAAGAGMHVFIAQFAKGMESSELRAFSRLSDRVVVRQFGLPRFTRLPTRADAQSASRGMQEIEAAIRSGEYGMVVLDEANIAVLLGLIRLEWLLSLIESKSDAMELVITGQGADPRLIERADLVTEMREIKHYYRQGILARVGIEM